MTSNVPLPADDTWRLAGRWLLAFLARGYAGCPNADARTALTLLGLDSDWLLPQMRELRPDALQERLFQCGLHTAPGRSEWRGCSVADCAERACPPPA